MIDFLFQWLGLHCGCTHGQLTGQLALGSSTDSCSWSCIGHTHPMLFGGACAWGKWGHTRRSLSQFVVGGPQAAFLQVSFYLFKKYFQITSTTIMIKFLISYLFFLCFSKSFVLSTAGFTCVAFVTGALAFFGPTFLNLGFKLIPGDDSTKEE